MIRTHRLGPAINKRSTQIWDELNMTGEPVNVLSLLIDMSDARSNAQQSIMTGQMAIAQKQMIDVAAWGAVIAGLLNEIDPKRSLMKVVQ